MKFFIDTANVDDIRKANDMGVICGVTTNPSLIAKEGRDFNEVIKEITSIVDGPISGEVKATTVDAEGMIKEGREIAAIHPNMVVKIPMTVEGLNYVNNLMESLNIPYEFMEWTSDIPETYWVGEYQEIEPLNEDGMEECNFILTGNTKGSFLNLETVKELLKDTLGCDGITDIMKSGSGIAIMYVTAYPVPSVEFGIHRLEITLRIKEWKV